jgi:hypothetical protein
MSETDDVTGIHTALVCVQRTSNIFTRYVEENVKHRFEVFTVRRRLFQNIGA